MESYSGRALAGLIAVLVQQDEQREASNLIDQYSNHTGARTDLRLIAAALSRRNGVQSQLRARIESIRRG